MMCKKCNLDMAVRSVNHELDKETLSLTLVQQMMCPKCKGEEIIYTPMPMTVKHA